VGSPSLFQTTFSCCFLPTLSCVYSIASQALARTHPALLLPRPVLVPSPKPSIKPWKILRTAVEFPSGTERALGHCRGRIVTTGSAKKKVKSPPDFQKSCSHREIEWFPGYTEPRMGPCIYSLKQ
jgi:hypothetical protein